MDSSVSIEKESDVEFCHFNIEDYGHCGQSHSQLSLYLSREELLKIKNLIEASFKGHNF